MEPVILYEDEHLIAVEKPSGMIVYPAKASRSDARPAQALRDGIHDYPALSSWLERTYTSTHGEPGFFFVHRIDRETSGVMVVARTEVALESLKAQFGSRDVQKTYRAFVYGNLKEERGTIDKPIGSSRGGAGPRSARTPYGRLREARTAFKTLAHTLEASYVELFPKTGRTHQIRVHLASIQHPIIRDPLYAPSCPPILGFSRLALHSFVLQITHPASGKTMRFEAPLSADFLAAEKRLRTGSF